MDLQSDFLALPYLTLVVGSIGSLLLFLNTDRQIRGLRSALKLQRERMVNVETHLQAGGLPPQHREPSDSATARNRVLELHGRGYSIERIAEESGLTQAEVDFVLKVDRCLGPLGQSVAIGKIS